VFCLGVVEYHWTKKFTLAEGSVQTITQLGHLSFHQNQNLKRLKRTSYNTYLSYNVCAEMLMQKKCMYKVISLLITTPRTQTFKWQRFILPFGKIVNFHFKSWILISLLIIHHHNTRRQTFCSWSFDLILFFFNQTSISLHTATIFGCCILCSKTAAFNPNRYSLIVSSLSVKQILCDFS